jgi:DNA-binding MarR family transcriptional regulator
MTTDVVNNNIPGYNRWPQDAAEQDGRMSDRRLAQTNASHSGTAASSRTGRARKDGRRSLDIGVLDDHLGYFVRRLQVWVFQDFIRTLTPIDISPAQYSVLVVIAANPGLSQSDLADRLGIERARLVRLLDKLERRGLTQRLASRSDRRSHALRLTHEGRRTLRQANVLAARHETQLVEKLGSERRKLLMSVLRDFER